MQFISDGPDVPEALLQAHEDGKVVFFCGAGISYPAGLPGFEGLVEKLYEAVGEKRDTDEKQLFELKRFDETIGHLENRIQGGRANVRRHLAEILKPDPSRKYVLRSHLALLVLSRRRDDRLRLVTTNFDTLFEQAAENHELALTIHPDPPARHPWQGLVYLHGRMPQMPTQDDLDRLILSDADFGKAYLTQAWAARFMAALFREYTVCFVGYSVNDPVLRYMTAAHAVLEGAHKIYAFAGHGPEDKDAQHQAWENKHVIPILYDDRQAHRHLHHTLQMWASLYRSGTRGRERLVARLAHRQPQKATQSNDFVGRMLWALSDPSGLPARRFAQLDPAPPLEWLLEAFVKVRYAHANLPRFGLPISHGPARAQAAAKNLSFSLMQRPTPSALAPYMALVSDGALDSGWDEVMPQLGGWLTRHLNDARLILWLAEQGGQLHPRFVQLIENKLKEIARLERNGETDKLDHIRLQAPNAIPSPPMRKLWGLLLGGRVKSPEPAGDLYLWQNRLDRDRLTTTLRQELRALLAPKVDLTPFPSDNHVERVNWELVLASDHVHAWQQQVSENANWQEALPVLLEDFQLLLRDALDLLRELGKADDRHDYSYIYLPSISPHWQNRGFHDWVSLIELLRDAWLAVRDNDPGRAIRIAQAWFELPYPSFKRLALFVASQDNCITPDQWVDWLLPDGTEWLWSVETQREMMRLLVLQGGHLPGAAQARLEAAIMAGPPRETSEDDPEPDQWQIRVEKNIWLRLAKLESSGLTLGAAAKARLKELSQLHPEWQLASNEQDEFSIWMSSTGDPGHKDDWAADAPNGVIEIAPRKRRELVEWLKQHPSTNHWHEDGWRQHCRDNFATAACALYALAKEGVWPTDRWREALHVWSGEGMTQRSWRRAALRVRNMPDDMPQAILPDFTWWLKAVAQSIDRHENVLLELCHRVLALPLEASTNMTLDGAPLDEPVTEALNHPVGHVTQAVINLWFKHKPKDDDGLPADIKSMFTELCDAQIDKFRHGRVLLAARVIELYRVDREWTTQHLLPLFDWHHSREARAVWKGFLWSPRLYPPLLKLQAFKSQFLESARHYSELGEHGRQYAAILTHAALRPAEGYTMAEFRDALAALPREGLEACALALVQALEAAADQRESYWKHHVQPLWQEAWPKSAKLASPSIAELLARLCIAAGAEFPDALNTLKDWLQSIKNFWGSSFIVKKLIASGLCTGFPDETLELLNTIIADDAYTTDELRACLDEIAQAQPELHRDPRYQRLDDYARKRNH